MTKSKRMVQGILDAIEQGRLMPGTRLASIREAARQHGVSKNTVVDAYDQLVALGRVRARQGAGFFVVKPLVLDTSEKTEELNEAVDSVSLLREQLVGNFAVRVGDGRAPASWMAGAILARLAKQLTAADSDLEYGAPQGYMPLRETIARVLAGRSIHATQDQVLLTFGANHAFDLIIRHFVGPGDSVLVETPGYYPLFGKLRLARAKLVGVPRSHEGLDLDDLERKIKQYRPGLFFLQPNAHNPTGTTLPPYQLHRLLTIAERYNVVLVEDDVFGDLSPRGSAHLAALDDLNRVIYVGSFSKTLSTGVRSGYLAGSPTLVSALTDIKMITVVNSSTFNERLIHDMIEQGRYRRHLVQLRERISKASASAALALKDAGIQTHGAINEGYYLWGHLPPGIDAQALARRASDEGIFIAPGAIFSLRPNGPDAGALRVHIAYANDHRFLDFLKRYLFSSAT
ncbi:PLP-dependent aminotransferase family protein [Vreelandella malpeensis]|uniref:PLP-dependent aminotransferase family protein n=1 Tax=Vreelandella malpeensis TaxID=1172368 RepID=A0ABS8DTK2_9GAMM|nr:PLP-dependent aminotransferase family protein [Halomonas malpeensis]MCB8889594.1 PLP-dependent aminotransferase family protein [Halomonas malpeensis]